MPFAIDCQKCHKLQDPYLDPQTNKVYCSLCDSEITNITSFVKNQLKMNKQYKVKSKTAFAVKCNNCNKEDTPKLLNEKIVCQFCNKELTNLSTPFILMLKARLKS